MAKAVIVDHRRKWNVNEYKEEEETDETEEKHEKKPVKRELLKARDYRIDLDSKLGKSVVVTKTTPSNQAGGYYCNVCDCIVKDSINFLDHVNGKKHQRNLGMSMKIERSTLDDVKKRFEINKRKLEESKKDYDFENRIKELKADEDKAKQRIKEKRKESKKAKTEHSNEQGDGNLDDQNEMMAIMGFSGFTSSKK